MSGSDGLFRTRTLTDAGTSERAIAAALREGRLVRVRKAWLARPDADPALVAAARAGVVLTCITQARRLGLWVLPSEGVHVAAPAHSGRAHMPGARLHWSRPIVPRHPDRLEDPVENVVAIAAQCQPYETSLAILESAMRKGLVTRAEMLRMPLPGAARRVVEAADEYADSGLETIVVPRLRWLCVPLRRQIWVAGHRVDLLIGDRLALQIDGGHHVGRQRDTDNAHDAALRLRGYTVIRVGYAQIVDRWHEVQEVVQRAVAQGLHEISPR